MLSMFAQQLCLLFLFISNRKKILLKFAKSLLKDMFKITPYLHQKLSCFLFSEAVGNIKFKIIAEDKRYAGCNKFFDSQPQNVIVNVGNCVSVKYDNSWWIGIILEGTPEDELLVKFMHPSVPRQTFY